MGGPGNDFVNGGKGSDNIPAVKKDIVLRGDSRAQVLAGRADVFAPDCERMVVVHGSLKR
jgi:hypothetical protein